jgi:hypothetical protein
MLDLIKRISELKDDVVFVGGVTMVHHGIKETAKDIDIRVLNLDGLEELGCVETWVTNSEMSKSKQRASIQSLDYLIDIFIEDELPEYVEHNGIKYGTINHLVEFYEELIPKTDGFPKRDIQSKLDMVINYIEKTKEI